jgi:hypothetical protein
MGRRLLLAAGLLATATLFLIAAERPHASLINDNLTRASGGIDDQLPDGAIRVNGNQPWTDSGVDVKKDEHYSFKATGSIVVEPGVTAAPDGAPGMLGRNYPVAGSQAGTLIVRVGSGAPFAIGTASQPVSMPATGRLMLGINDDDFGDNSGFFAVVVTREKD